MIDNTVCPLCQLSNYCGIESEAPCWCTKTDIPKELISQVPSDFKSKTCICQACVDKFKLDTKLGIERFKEIS